MRTSIRTLSLASALLSLMGIGTTTIVRADDAPKAPDNATLVSEVDGCRVWRIADNPDSDTARKAANNGINIQPRVVYFTKCGNIVVPTIQPETNNR